MARTHSATPIVRRRRSTSRRLQLELLEERTLLSVEVYKGTAGLSWLQTGGCQPPNPNGDVGHTHYLQGLGDTVFSYDRATGESQVIRLGPLFQDPKVFAYCDTQVAYDDVNQRFIVTALGSVRDHLLRKYLFVAVSDTSNPADGFSELHRFTLEQTDGTNVYHAAELSLGFNGEALVGAVRMGRQTGPGSMTFSHTQVVAVDVLSLLDYDPATVDVYSLDVQNPLPFLRMAAATSHDAGPGAPVWLVGGSQPNANVHVVRIDQILSAEPFVEAFFLSVPPFAYAPNAPQPGGVIQTSKFYMETAAWRGDRLVAAHNVGVDGIARARWYEIDTTGGIATLIQVGHIDAGPDTYTYHPAVEIGASGEIGLAYTQSSAKQYLSMYVTGRYPDEVPGTMQPPVLVDEGQGSISGLGAGFYGGISVDPLTGSSFWATNASAPQTNGYFTWIVHFAVLPDSGPGGFVPGSGDGQSQRSAGILLLTQREERRMSLHLESTSVDQVFRITPGDSSLGWLAALDGDSARSASAHGTPMLAWGSRSRLLPMHAGAELSAESLWESWGQ